MSPLFAVVAWDRPNSASVRADARTDHFAYIETVIDQIAVAGPMKDENGTMIGSLFIIRAVDSESAVGLFQNDPYFRAGLWARWHIQPFMAAAGDWIGGKTW